MLFFCFLGFRLLLFYSVAYLRGCQGPPWLIPDITFFNSRQFIPLVLRVERENFQPRESGLGGRVN